MAWSGGEFEVYLYRSGSRTWQPIGRCISSPNETVFHAVLSGFRTMYMGVRHRPTGRWNTYYIDASGSVSAYG
jgi:hypothetical protein